MTYSGVDHPRARRGGWERLMDVKLKPCELTIFVGGALLVGLIGLAAGGGGLGL